MYGVRYADVHPSNADLGLQPAVIRSQTFPQQLPGPAQPAWPGEEPQQAVSPGPGMAPDEVPDKDECADMSFFTLPLPHCSQ
jgi:hypothetical protein